MKRDFATAIIVVVLVVLLIVALTENRRDEIPIIPTPAAYSCQPLPNPCDTIDCRKPDTKRIA